MPGGSRPPQTKLLTLLDDKTETLRVQRSVQNRLQNVGGVLTQIMTTSLMEVLDPLEHLKELGGVQPKPARTACRGHKPDAFPKPQSGWADAY
jgi:hypothetical protein